jgi:hypothetical protein
VIRVKTGRILIPFLLAFLLFVSVFNFYILHPIPYLNDNNSMQTTVNANGIESTHDENSRSVEDVAPNNSSPAFLGGVEMVQASSLASSPSFSRHMMCKDYHYPFLDVPVEPTTTFRPTDEKAVCLTTVWINDSIEFRWYYRDNSSKAWVYTGVNHTESVCLYAEEGGCYFAAYLSIAGYWPSVYYPRAYKVDVCLDGLYSFSDFFEVTNGGFDSPRLCESIDPAGQPMNMKSRFTIGSDTQVYHYLKFDKMAYFNEELGKSHIFTSVWVQPDGMVYATHSESFGDYKDSAVNLTCWESVLVSNDSISINPSMPIGNWKVEVYMDSHLFNNTWGQYGPVATTPFVIGNESVADWTFMVYLDSDNSLANATVGSGVHDLGVDVFLEMASVELSSNVNVVVQLDRANSLDERYGNWTGTKRFKVTRGMTPTVENAVQDLGEVVDMGDPNTLRDFVNWTINNYPARFFFLVLWDHGSGCMGVCEDVTNGSDFLSLPEISDALNRSPVIIDGLLIDACSMGMLEVAYQVSNSVNILAGPEGLGYAPAPYDYYLNSLMNDTSVSPRAFAAQIVDDYRKWCIVNSDQIKNATMTSIDLTKMTALAANVDDFAALLKEKETIYHEPISLARNATKGYPGPLGQQVGSQTVYQTGYYVDLYSFASEINQNVQDQQLKDASDRVMNAVENAVVFEFDINDRGTNGVAVYFPADKSKYDYDSFADIYEATSFAEDTSWDEFVRQHVSGFVVTVKTGFHDMPVKIDEDFYNTTVENETSVFLQPGFHTVNVSKTFAPTGDLESVRAIFIRWKDSGSTIPTRTFNLEDGNLAFEAEYSLEYRLIIDTTFLASGGQTEPPVGTYWYAAGFNVNVSALPPSTVTGENYTDLMWIQSGARNSSATGNPDFVSMDGPINVTAVWRHVYSLTVISEYGTPTPSTEWEEAETTINCSVAPIVAGTTGTRYVCTGWSGTGSVASAGDSGATNFTLSQPSSIQWNWKTQYLLSVYTDPKGMSPQPNISPAGSWYDGYTNVTCTAEQVNGYAFQQWHTERANWDVGANPITVTMDGPYDLTARYVHAQAWWELLFRQDVLQNVLAILGIGISLSLVGGAWFRSRKRRDIVKTFLAEIDDVRSRFKTDPKKCEEEFYRLRNTVLEGLTQGKISEENYDIIDRRLDKYMSEISKEKESKGSASN